MDILRLLFSQVSGKLFLIISLVGGGIAAFWKGYSEGVEREQAKQKEREYESLKRESEINEDLAYMSDDAVDSELRKYIKERDKS